ncbi:hypothetical protein NX059_001774 [Plenodomus lindquistii]|nr:hypothetical protein NX059_001774 [Plenodomus lindquistii]
MTSNGNADYEALPNKAQFLDKHLHVLDNCAVCLEAFDNVHAPAQIRTCHHIFGITCLSTWIETSPTCPLCRTELFAEEVGTEDGISDEESIYEELWSEGSEYSPSEDSSDEHSPFQRDAPNFVPGSRVPNARPNRFRFLRIGTSHHASTLTMRLWEVLYNKFCSEIMVEMYDTDIEEAINEAMKEMSYISGPGCFRTYSGLDHMPALVHVAKAMIRTQLADEHSIYTSEEDLRGEWLPMMAEALDWDFLDSSE